MFNAYYITMVSLPDGLGFKSPQQQKGFSGHFAKIADISFMISLFSNSSNHNGKNNQIYRHLNHIYRS